MITLVAITPLSRSERVLDYNSLTMRTAVGRGLELLSLADLTSQTLSAGGGVKTRTLRMVYENVSLKICLAKYLGAHLSFITNESMTVAASSFVR
jgi:hypothetical protein